MARFGPVLAPAGWGLLTFAVFFHYAQFIDKVAWNAIELIIAQKLGEHGVYATSLDYASAIAWRPVLPTLVVAFFQLWTEDPILIYQLVCGLSFASLVVAMFRSGRLLGNALTGHLAAFGAVSCPAVTTFLVHHFHSYSHIVTLGFLGPAIQASLSLLIAVESRPAPPLRRYLGVGLWWGLAYLCRSELLLFFGGFLIILAWRTWRGRSRFGPLLGTLGMFLLCFVPYNAYAAQATARDGILIRKTIFGFYMSQGWADPPADATADTEADGYTYAIKLYGDPKENGESLARAILRNPSAFQRRVGLNARRFYALYFDGKFIAPWLTGSALVLLLAAGVLDARRRPLAIFLLGLFVATHAILVFHVDARYLTISVPALILGAVMLVHVVLCWVRRRLPALPVWALGGLVLAGVAWSAWWQLRTLWPGGQPGGTGPAAMKVLGEHFRSTVKQPRLAANAEPHIALLLPAPSPVAPEDVFLLPYFSHTAWVNRGAEGKFPRGRFYSFRDVEDDYVYAPAELRQAAQFQKARLVSEFQHPLLGPYLLYEMHP